MIKILKIKNFAIIKDLEVNFKNGFNVFIGETGAGKSIILKALSFILGEKGNKTQIRSGEQQIKVEAIFENYSQNTLNVLNNLGIENEDIIIISRSYDLDGKNECRINGNIVTMMMLKQISETLVDSYGQHENQMLLKTSNHINILDNYKPIMLVQDKTTLHELMQEYKAIKKQLDEIGGNFDNRKRMLDLLDYQITEIDDIAPKENEDEDLETQLTLIKNTEKINTALQNAINSLSGNGGTSENLKETIKNLNSIIQYNDNFSGYIERITTSLYDLVDVCDSLKEFKSNNFFDEFEFEKIDERLDKIKMLKKKYGPTLSDVLTFFKNAKADKDKLENADYLVEKLTKQLKGIEEKLFNISSHLSNTRKTLALEIEKRIEEEFKFLGMKNAKFKIDFKDLSEVPTYSTNGFDNVEFLFSANLGQDLKSLNKTISGGEMSRFMLALKNIIASNDGVSTLVFDEVDAGISGEIGSAIAERIARLAVSYQILCITHLPQVSAMADNYFYVSKENVDNSTRSKITNLQNEEILQAIAKLSGGQFNTEISLAHARELKSWAENFKKTLDN